MVGSAGQPSRPRIRLEVRGYRIPVGSRNLAWRAAEALLRETGRNDRIAIRLEKRIPPGSGLGGGSSDAAAVLRGLDRLLRLRIPSARLRRIAASLGSDVPFFLGKESIAVASGRGEIVRGLAASRPAWFVLVLPGIRLSTASVYAGARNSLTRPKRLLSVIARDLRLRRIRTLREKLFNQLETSAARLQPRVGSMLRRLRASNLPFHLTGSGSAIFLPCISRREAEFVRATLLRWGSHRVVLVRSLTGRPIREERRRGGGDHGGTHQAAGRQG
jgi:4-diphosphocytidyl-2-C-methyl-D-erythritol kinase